MNRLRLFGIGLAIAISLVALAPNQLNAFDGSQNEYKWIARLKHAIPLPWQDDEGTNGRTDGFDGAEAEYLDISKDRTDNHRERTIEFRDGGRIQENFVPVTNKADSRPC